MIPHHLHFCNTGIARIFVKRTDVFGHASKIAVNMHCYLAYTVYSSSLYTTAPLLSPCFSTFLSTSLPSIFIYGLLQELRHSASVKNRLCKTNPPPYFSLHPLGSSPAMAEMFNLHNPNRGICHQFGCIFPIFLLAIPHFKGYTVTERMKKGGCGIL